MSKKMGRDAVVVAFVDAYATTENTGSKIAQVCAIANTTFRGADVSKEDADYIADTIAKQRDWEGATAKVRKSEVRRVLSVYTSLPEGITSVREKTGSCDWRAALRLATLLKKNENKLRPALAAFHSQSEGRKSSPQGHVAGALKRWYKAAKGDKRALILKAAELLNIKLGIKVEA